MSGPPWSTRPRSRRSALSRRRSRPRAYVEGSVRDRHTSPSSLSKVSSWADMPTKPASSASTRWPSIATSSASVGATSLRVARSRPISAERMSEWPMKAATLGPSGSASSASAYSWADDQVRVRSSASMTWRRGIASTRPKRSPAVVGSTWTVDREQEPDAAPWSRRDATTRRGRAPRAPRCRSGCGCRPSPAAPTDRSRRRPALPSRPAGSRRAPRPVRPGSRRGAVRRGRPSRRTSARP